MRGWPEFEPQLCLGGSRWGAWFGLGSSVVERRAVNTQVRGSSLLQVVCYDPPPTEGGMRGPGTQALGALIRGVLQTC